MFNGVKFLDPCLNANEDDGDDGEHTPNAGGLQKLADRARAASQNEAPKVYNMKVENGPTRRTGSLAGASEDQSTQECCVPCRARTSDGRVRTADDRNKSGGRGNDREQHCHRLDRRGTPGG